MGSRRLRCDCGENGWGGVGWDRIGIGKDISGVLRHVDDEY